MAQRGSYAKGVAKREEILATALEVIAREGYRGASVKVLAEAVGLSQAGLLHYFDSKDELFTEILRKRDDLDLATYRTPTRIRCASSSRSCATTPRPRTRRALHASRPRRATPSTPRTASSSSAGGHAGPLRWDRRGQALGHPAGSTDPLVQLSLTASPTAFRPCGFGSPRSTWPPSSSGSLAFGVLSPERSTPARAPRDRHRGDRLHRGRPGRHDRRGPGPWDVARGESAAFLGIPFAEALVGALRFAAPVRVDPGTASGTPPSSARRRSAEIPG